MSKARTFNNKKKVEEPLVPITVPTTPSVKLNTIIRKKQKIPFNNEYQIPIVEETRTKPLKKKEEVVVVHGNEKTMNHINFCFFSAEEIRKFSVVEITDIKNDGPGSLYDLKMGPANQIEICETCGEGWDTCPGHFGYIRLNEPVPHPLCSKQILEFLNLFCYNEKCNRLVMTEEKLKLLNVFQMKGDSRFIKILDYVRTKVNVCSHADCQSFLPEYKYEDGKYYMKLKNKVYPLSYNKIASLFSNIPECDIALLGLDSQKVHPMRFILTVLPVLPPCARPYGKGDDSILHDDFTYKYMDILKLNQKLAIGKSEKSHSDAVEGLMFHIHTLMDNSKGHAKEVNGKRPIKCVKSRLTGKQGLIRGHMQGKRVDFNSRTVISGDNTVHVDEMIIPEEVSKILTVPIRVTSSNIDLCYSLLSKGKVNTVIRDGKTINARKAMNMIEYKPGPNDYFFRGDRKYKCLDIIASKGKMDIQEGDRIGKLENGEWNYMRIPEKKMFALKEGDIVERQMQNGDWVIFNRQPTLWKGSMQGKKVIIRPGKTFRFSLSCTQAMNADL